MNTPSRAMTLIMRTLFVDDGTAADVAERSHHGERAALLYLGKLRGLRLVTCSDTGVWALTPEGRQIAAALDVARMRRAVR